MTLKITSTSYDMQKDNTWAHKNKKGWCGYWDIAFKTRMRWWKIERCEKKKEKKKHKTMIHNQIQNKTQTCPWDAAFSAGRLWSLLIIPGPTFCSKDGRTTKKGYLGDSRELWNFQTSKLICRKQKKEPTPITAL